MVENRRPLVLAVAAVLVLLALLSLSRGALRRPAPAPGIPGQQTPIQPAPGEAPGAPGIVPGTPNDQLQPGLPVPGECLPVAPGADGPRQ